MNWNAIWNSFLFSWGFANVTDHVQIMFSLMCTTNWICCCWRLFVARLWNINHSVNWLLDVMNKSKIMRKMIFNRIDYNYFIRYFYTFRFEIIFNFRQVNFTWWFLTLNFFFNENEFHHISFLSIVPSNSPVADAFYSRFNCGERGFIESRILFDSIHGVLCKSIRNSVPVARKVPEYNSHGKTILLLSSIVIEIITQLFNLPPSTHAAAIGSCMILARALREKKEEQMALVKESPPPSLDWRGCEKKVP